MSRLAIIGTIEVIPGARDQLLTALMAHKARCLRDEPGTLAFEILLPEEDETRVQLYEVYQDASAFETHRGAESIVRFREETAGIVVRLEVTKYALAG